MKNSEKENPVLSDADQLVLKLMDSVAPVDILLVDDVHANIFLLESLLSDKYTTYSVNSAAKMWEYLETRKPKLILLDLMMPYENGFEILEKLKADQYKNVSVIVVSAKDVKTDVVKALQLGAVDYIVKPINENTLVPKIEKVIKPTKN